jgi:hypothetical protein
MAAAHEAGLIDGRPVDLAEQFGGLLWRDLMISLLLGVAERSTPRAIEARARDAVTAFLLPYIQYPECRGTPFKREPRKL